MRFADADAHSLEFDPTTTHPVVSLSDSDNV